MDIKICGLKTEEAVRAVIDGGASHAGFIFFPKSPRNVSPQEAAPLAALAADAGLTTVAVTVDADDTFLDEIVSLMKPAMLQLHGKETAERLAELKKKHGLPVMKAFAIREKADLAAIEPYHGIADLFLFDAKPPLGAELPGGNGIPFDWQVLNGLDPAIDYMLSGGLNSENIETALDLLDPPGLDISSGVESGPGTKDPAMIETFLNTVRQAASKDAA